MELVRILILIILSFLLLTTKLGLRFYIALLVLTDVIQVPVNVNVLQGGRELYVTRPVLLYTAKIVPSPYFMFNCFTCSYRCDPGTGKCKCSSDVEFYRIIIFFSFHGITSITRCCFPVSSLLSFYPHSEWIVFLSMICK